MWRWLFLFLLLANAIVMMWYSLQIPESKKQTVRQSVTANELKLVSEISADALSINVKRHEVESCTFFYGLETAAHGDALVSFVRENGFEAESLEYTELVEVDFTVVVALPDSLNERLEVLDYLEQYEHKQLDEGVLGFEYVLTGFIDRESAELKVAELNAIGIQNELHSSQREEKTYTVIVSERFDRNLSNEIKEIVRETYSLEKIEKKVCERVAKP